MQVFISWSGKRGHQMAMGLSKLLPEVILSLQHKVFVSSTIEKGIHWFSAIVHELKCSDIGIICLTPESMNSNWLHFEAGALANHLSLAESQPGRNPDHALNESRLYTYLHQLKPGQISGPLSSYQSTSSTKQDTEQLLKSIINTLPVEECQREVEWNIRFAENWESFEKLLEKAEVSIQELIPEFESLFQRKTFNEPLQLCRAQKWLDRHNGALETLLKLQNYAPLVRGASRYQVDLFEILQLQVDSYVMSLELLLKADPFPLNELGYLEFHPPGLLTACESCRINIKDTVSRILDPLNVPKTDDAVRFTKCETFAQKKLLVHRKEYEVRHYLEQQVIAGNPAKGHDALKGLIDTKTLEELSTSTWELDRIYYYLLFENLMLPSNQYFERALHEAQMELEKVLSANENSSMMPLSYGLGALEAMIKHPVDENLKTQAVDFFKELREYIMKEPAQRDAGQQIRRLLGKIETRLAEESSTVPCLFEPTVLKLAST